MPVNNGAFETICVFTVLTGILWLWGVLFWDEDEEDEGEEESLSETVRGIKTRR